MGTDRKKHPCPQYLTIVIGACPLFAVDRDPAAVQAVRQLAARLAPALPQENFQGSEIDRLPFPDGSFDLVISSAVLHFARDEAHFRRMLDAMWQVTKTGGIFFARLASTIGLEEQIQPLGNRRFQLPDGSSRFLVDAPMLVQAATRLGAAWLDPLKTTNVQDQRCMTTLCWRK